ncbi:hypothetical protein L1987_42857 [Smallanthus sonchifolius]|uniref:Uncharacterized protein n=1 Tax=Smallanthus sonchifolius TaxID=185202 RepID=A0ACB9GKQ1_9ASTR|nr:hypothetical protein L1987_42857 [Smallanthus sonchifolius]
MQCPASNSFTYNSSLCACNPGFLYNPTANTCSPFTVSGADAFFVGTGVDYSINFPETEAILSFESIKKYTRSQYVFLGATFVVIIIWLLFCVGVRFGNVGDGRTWWYKIRWWISRMDVCFATCHWLDDQKVVKKRKTELGGAFSIASCILFIGLLAALLYQVISKRTIEVRSVVAANAPDFTSFGNDMEFNITTISTMSCSNIQNLGTLFVGNPGFLDFRTAPLSTFANFSCHNTTKGPMMTLKCSNCQLIRDNFYTSWQFIDLPNIPASAVGFKFNLTSRDRDTLPTVYTKKHMSIVSGILKKGSNMNADFVTFRGKDPNIFKFNLFPQIYRNKHDLKLIQPLFHEFLPGSSFGEINLLRASLQNSSNGIVNITLHVNFLSSYIVEIDNQNVLGPVGFLADLGGLYCVSIGLFFYFLVQLRKYVAFTWSRGSLPHENGNGALTSCCSGILIKPNQNEGSLSKRKQHIRKDNISFNKKVSIPDDKVSQKEWSDDVDNQNANGQQPLCSVANDIPLPPSLETESGSETSALEIQKNLQDLYEYNLMLREELILAQSMLHSLTSNDSAPKGQ